VPILLATKRVDSEKNKKTTSPEAKLKVSEQVLLATPRLSECPSEVSARGWSVS